MHLIDVERVVPGERLAECVDRTGANVAKHNADRADRQLQCALPLMGVRASAHFRQRSNSGRVVHECPWHILTVRLFQPLLVRRHYDWHQLLI